MRRVLTWEISVNFHNPFTFLPKYCIMLVLMSYKLNTEKKVKMEKTLIQNKEENWIPLPDCEKVEDEDWIPIDEDSHLMLEMATIGWPNIDGVEYKMSIHGVNTRDRPTPHIHLDRADDPNKESFKFEISLIDMLQSGEPVLILQKDTKNHIDRKNRRLCSWDGYSSLRQGVISFLESEPEDANAPKGARTNLESFVINWNRESGSDPNRLANYIKGKGVSVLPKYREYFPTLYPY